MPRQLITFSAGDIHDEQERSAAERCQPPMRESTVFSMRRSLECDSNAAEGGQYVSEHQSYEYQGYTIRNNPETGRWEILWKDVVKPIDFSRAADAEQWIDDEVPLNR
jgi:hypothetical protein